jgi:hypothetical protein
MHIKIKTAEEFRSSHVTIEVTADGPADMGRSEQTGNGWAKVMMEQRDEIERLTDTSEYYVRTIDNLKADLARERAAHVCTSRCSPNSHVAIKGRRLVTELEAEVQQLKDQLSEVQNIVDHPDVTAQLDPNNATGSWGETLAIAIENVRRVLSSSPSSQA